MLCNTVFLHYRHSSVLEIADDITKFNGNNYYKSTNHVRDNKNDENANVVRRRMLTLVAAALLQPSGILMSDEGVFGQRKKLKK